MKNIYILFLTFYALSLSANTPPTDNDISKTSLTGKIKDKGTGEAIIGATVYIPDLKTGAITDTSGQYIINNLPKTKVLVEVRFLGYQTVVEKVDLAAIQTLDFNLVQSVTEVNEVVITGTSKATEITRNPVPMVTMTRRELQQNLSTNIIDAITNLPGVSAVTTGPNVAKPFIHGLGFNRVLTLYDGVRLEGQQWGDEHGIEVDENAVDRVEVVKGPASLTYGSDALAGVVNLIPPPMAPEGTINGRILANYQSNNGLIMGSSSIAGNNNGFVWGGTLSHKQATNYQNKYDGRVYGTAFNETDFTGYIGLNKSWGYSHLTFALFDDLQEIPDGSRDSATRKFTRQITEADTFRPIVTNSELNSYKITTLHQHVQHYSLYSSNNFILGRSKLGLILGLQQSVRREYSHPEYPDLPGLYLILNTFNYDVKYYPSDIDGWETTFGINGMYQDNTNKGTEFIIPDYRQFDAGPFVLIQKTIDKLDIIGGLRYDMRIFKNNAMYTGPNPETGFDMKVGPAEATDQPFYNFNHTYSGLSGSFGAAWRITNNLVMKGNIARGFRAPNIAEISANGVHPGTLIYQIGNKDFKPEFSLQEDFGITCTSRYITGNIEFFNNSISNYIFNGKLLNKAGEDSVIVTGNQTFKFQQSKAQLYGGEASLDIHPHPLDWLHFENSISFIYALNKGGNGLQINDSNKYLPFIPPLHTTTELRANLKKKFRYFSSIYAQVEMQYYARQNRVYLADNTETPTPGYVLYNAGVGADITNSRGKVLFTFDIQGNNITNVAYQSHLSRLKYFEPYPDNPSGRSGIYDMGRNISFKITVPLDIKK